jgi:oligopeptide/dipeptide ABC transporter ATP-binding protein
MQDGDLAPPLLQVQDLDVRFRSGGGEIRAVRGVSFCVRSGETVGIVGESGCGKSVTALSLLRLIPDPPGRIVGGAIRLGGEDVLAMPEERLRALRGGRVSMVFQDPFSSLNPTMRLGDQVMEALRVHGRLTRTAAAARALDLLRSVRLPSPETRMRQYPHQVSGGQRQRVMIAMAFAADPELLIADEPTTALDVTVQAQIMALMQEMQLRTNAAVLLISHDIALVAEMCDRVLVMYAGQIVEQGPTEQVVRSPQHPYTIGLLESMPDLRTGSRGRLRAIPGQPPDLGSLPVGCAFAPRCPVALPICREQEPGAIRVGDGREVRCVLRERERRPT